MIFRIYLYLYIFTIFFIFNRIPIEIILLIWYFRRILFFIKINSHISFILLSLELISVISLTLISLLLLKKLIEVRFFSFYLSPCGRGLFGAKANSNKFPLSKKRTYLSLNYLIKLTVHSFLKTGTYYY